MAQNFSINPLVSIVMPAYNCENYIAQAIQSVKAQTYLLWELIVIDDGSADSTADKIKLYSNNDKRIRFYENSINIGVAETRNKAISLAQGEWVAFLDSDDIWESCKLERQLKLANKVNGDFIFSGSSYINEEGKKYKGIFEVPNKVNYNSLKKHNMISCSSVIVKKHFFDSLRMENDSLHEDYLTWLRILRSGVIAYGINEPLLVYRISQNSKSGNKVKSIGMTYKVYRALEMHPIVALYLVINHSTKAYLKYRVIKGNNYD